MLRAYDSERDKQAVHRIWMEVGWLGKEKAEELDLYIKAGRGFVAEVHGEAECLVATTPGTLRYLEEDLPMSAVSGVTTSRVARKQGLAGRLTAKAIATDAMDGALVSGLSMFEQGYYNQLGFGTNSYENTLHFDPAHLTVRAAFLPPRRFTEDDWEMVHRARLTRLRGHGSCNLTSPTMTRADMHETQNGFGLGYRDEASGEMTHGMWCGTSDVENGPYRVGWMVYHDAAQFLELMALLKSLGDQVALVRMREPAGMQLQDLIRQPFRHRMVTRKSKYEGAMHAVAYYQFRICDLAGCLAHTHLRGETIRFNLSLSDPITRYLEDDSAWRGVGGEYIVTFGPESQAERGQNPALPTLNASVGAFTRMWLGVCPATGLAVTDELSGPSALLEQLDWTLRLPMPSPDWEF